MVIVDFQPFAFLVVLMLEHAAKRNTSTSSVVAPLLTYHPDQPVPCHIRGSGSGNIIFCVTLRAIFKTETEVTLFAMTVVIFKPSLTAATKVFNRCPSAVVCPRKVLAKPQAGQKTSTERCHFCLSVYQLPARRDGEDYPHNQELNNQSCRSKRRPRPTICW